MSNPFYIELSENIAMDAYGCNLDNTFLIFETKSKIFYLIYSSIKKSIIAFNLNNMQIDCKINNAHKDYIDNFRHSYDIKHKRDIILSLSSGNNNIKIWDVNNWNCLYNINNIYKVGILLSACFLINENMNYIITCNCFIFNIIVIDFEGKKIKEFNNSYNYTLFIDTYFDIKQNKYYVITGNRNNVKSYDYNTNKLYYSYDDGSSTNHRSVLINNVDEVVRIIFPCEEGFIKIFSFHTGILLNKINLNNEPLTGICFWNKDFLFGSSKNKTVNLIIIKFGECLITQGLDNKIKLWIIKKV